MRTLACLCTMGLWIAGVAHGQQRTVPEGGEEVQAQAETAASPAADPAAEERAREHFRMGVGFFRERNYAAALIEFQRAYELVPHYKLLFNLGQTRIELQHYAEAVDDLQSYLEQGGAEIPPERRGEVEQMIAQQEARLGEVVVDTDQSGAEVYVDDRKVGVTPLEGALRLGAGRRRLALVKPGFATAERSVELAAGDSVTLELPMQPLAEETAAGEAFHSDYPMAPQRSSNTGAWVAGITTLALAAGTVTMAVLTLRAENMLEDERGTTAGRSRLQKLSDRVETRALITDIGLGATLVSGVVTAIFLATSEGAEREMDGLEAAIDLAPDRAQLRVGSRF